MTDFETCVIMLLSMAILIIWTLGIIIIKRIEYSKNALASYLDTRKVIEDIKADIRRAESYGRVRGIDTRSFDNVMEIIDKYSGVKE